MAWPVGNANVNARTETEAATVDVTRVLVIAFRSPRRCETPPLLLESVCFERLP